VFLIEIDGSDRRTDLVLRIVGNRLSRSTRLGELQARVGLALSLSIPVELTAAPSQVPVAARLSYVPTCFPFLYRALHLIGLADQKREARLWPPYHLDAASLASHYEKA
jgi:hypothetical protein